MDLNRVHRKFATNAVDGWDSGKWVEEVASGALEVYSRFITERTFGAVKRIFMCPKEVPENYSAIRFKNGSRYLLAKQLEDVKYNVEYAFIYLLQEVNDEATIVSVETKVSASGIKISDQVSIKSEPILCYHERYGATTSTEVDDVTYARTRILLPKGTQVDLDNEIEIGQDSYSIDEIDQELDMVRIYGLKR